MTFKIPKEPFNACSFRECHFYIDYLNQAHRDANFQSIDSFNTVQDCLAAFRKELSYLEKRKKINEKQIERMRIEFEKDQLSSEDFEWLENSDERFINWVWCYLRHESKGFDRIRYRRQLMNKLPNNKQLPDLGLDLDFRASFEGLAHSAFKRASNNIAARKRDIIESFRSSELGRPQQLEISESLLNSWDSISEHTKISDWLEENDLAQINWSWKYLKEAGYRLQDKVWSVSNDSDKDSAIIAIFDMLYDNPDRKALLIDKMKRAWSQKKFREKSSGKKPYSVSMTDRTKTRLTWLVEQEDSSISEVIKELIDTRFNQLKLDK